MQQKHIEQKHIEQKYIQQKQMQQRQFTRQHNQHEHSMTIANPQKDSREMYIPSGTIVEDPPRKIRFPYLRSWIMSLLALILLPLGAIFVIAGTAIADNLGSDWQNATAEVERVSDDVISYSWTANGQTLRGNFSRDWQTYLNAKANGTIAAQFTLCDVVGSFVVPRENGAEFNIWYDPQSPAQHQCVPMSESAGAGFVVAGWIMLVFALWTFVRIFHRAGVQLARR